MTIQQIFPGIWNKPGGAIIAVADNFFNLLGPGQQVTTELAGRWLNTYISQIKSLDPNYQFQDSGLATTFEGQIYQLNFLRMKRAETYLRIKGDPRPLQVETLRFMQERADRAYNQGMRLLQAGKLPRQLSSQEALGNYVDREVREALRERYNVLGINWNGKGPVRVNSREYDNSGTDRTYRIPDVRIYDLVIDTSLTAKGPATPQVKGFFATDFRPTLVIILRPSQLGRGHTYAIPRMENKR
ncbi:hypothetical protein J2W22_002434 [Sphingomonas kyeonggiensis]|nr:hypothetical protein [Sphingomonas kyeonggiensis]